MIYNSFEEYWEANESKLSESMKAIAHIFPTTGPRAFKEAAKAAWDAAITKNEESLRMALRERDRLLICLED